MRSKWALTWSHELCDFSFQKKDNVQIAIWERIHQILQFLRWKRWNIQVEHHNWQGNYLMKFTGRTSQLTMTTHSVSVKQEMLCGGQRSLDIVLVVLFRVRPPHPRRQRRCAPGTSTWCRPRCSARPSPPAPPRPPHPPPHGSGPCCPGHAPSRLWCCQPWSPGARRARPSLRSVFLLCYLQQSIHDDMTDWKSTALQSVTAQ